MLLSFSVENYLSFRDKAVLELIPDALKEYPENLHTPILYDLNFKLLKSMSIYGHNSHGKSNFIKSYIFFQRLILHSTDPNTSENIDVDNFRLNKATTQRPSSFEIIFLLQKTRYRYGFRVMPNQVIEEWLYYAEARVRENYLFHRVDQETKVSRIWQKEVASIVERSIHFTQKHQLLLSSLITARSIPQPVDQIASWLKGNVILADVSEEENLRRAMMILSVNEYRPLIQTLIDRADLGFISIQNKIDSLTTNKLAIDEEILKMWYKAELMEFSLYTRHNVYDSAHNKIDSVYFEFLKNESAGTLRFLVVACFLAYAIKKGQLILIDEIDSKFHSDLLQLLIQFYNDPAINVSGSQMIFTTHNTILLNNMLRRDQVMLIEKNEFGESTIKKAHSADNPIRLDASIEKEYRKGKLGGVSKKLREDNNQRSFDF